jgi:hypothetical protein
VDISKGSRNTPVISWFAEAVARNGQSTSGTGAEFGLSSAALSTEIIALERDWLIDSGQAHTPHDSWELRGSNRWHHEARF